MMSTSLDARQSQMRTLLDQINSAVVTQLDSTLEAANSEVTPPGRLIAQATPSLVVTIGSGTVVNPNTLKNRVLPFLNNTQVSFTGGTITFPSTSGTITVSPGSNASITIGANQFVAVLVQLTSTGQLLLSVGAAAGSLGAVIVPNSSSSALPLGYIIAQSNGSSVIQSITNGMLYQFTGGGGSGGSTGGGSGINYLMGETTTTDSSTFETGIGNWVAYANTPGIQPINGSGGSPTVTITQTVSSPLRGSGSGLITKTAVNSQGQGASVNFTIDPADEAKLLAVQFDYIIGSGTFNAGSSSQDSDIEVWVYDVTNAVLIPVTPYKLISNSASTPGTFKGTFQTNSNSISYRLILHIPTTNASAWTFKYDNVSVGPQAILNAPSVSDWTGFTITPTATGSNPSKGTVVLDVAVWRRVGDSMEIHWEFNQSAGGSAGSGTYMLNLPPGYSIDTSKIGTDVSFQQDFVGTGSMEGGGFDSPTGIVAYNTTHLAVALFTSGTVVPWVATSSADFASDLRVSLDARIPILGWSSNVVTGNDADARAVAARAASTTNYTVAANAPVIFDTADFDTHSAYSTVTGIYTIPVSGPYNINVTGTSVTTGYTLYAVVNGVARGSFFSGTASLQESAGGLNLNLRAGDQLAVYSNSSITLQGASALGFATQMSIQKVSGPALPLPTETIAASYYATPGTQSITANVQINYDTKVYDSHGAVTVGSTWKFTAPTSGLYKISEHGQVATTPASFVVYKNGTEYSYTTTHLTSGIFSGEVEIQLLAGDFIDIRPDTSTTLLGGNSPAIISQIFVRRVGNYL